MKITVVISLSLMCLACNFLYAQTNYFKNYQASDGLSNNTITSIVQDHQGFLWFGSRNGLNRFDGKLFKIFRHHVMDQNSIGSSSILSLLIDKKGVMWVGTTQGVYLYNALKENFTYFSLIPSGEIRAIKECGGYIWIINNGKLYRYDPEKSAIRQYERGNIIAWSANKKGELWIANSNDVLYRYDTAIADFSQVRFPKAYKDKLSNIRAIHGISDSRVIVGTTNTAYLVDLKADKLVHIYKGFYPKMVVQTNTIMQQSESVFWLGTETGIYTYDMDSGHINTMQKDPFNALSLSNNVIQDFYIDKEGSIWTGTFFGGVNQYINQFDNFKKYQFGFGRSSLSGNIVHEICKDLYGNLWIGTEDGGLNKVEAQSGQIQHLLANRNKGSITYNNIHGLATVGDELWIGSTTHGLDILDIKTGKLKQHFSSIGEGAMHSKFVVCIYKMRNNDMLVGTNLGLYKYDRKNKLFKLLPLRSAWIQGIYEDKDGVLWINTYGSGVYIYDIVSGKINQLYADQRKANGLINNYVNGLFEDSKGNIWLCTEEGLSRYQRNGMFVNFLMENGLPSNQVFKALEDSNHSLWISTGGGLVKMEENNPTMTVYTTRDGLPSEQFNYNSAFKDNDGTLYFGTIKGMVSFNPAKAVKNWVVPPTFISDIKINNTSVLIGKGGLLHEAVPFSKEIKLSYDNSNININIAALSYVSPENNKYTYIMGGYDKHWTEITGSQKIHYNKLPPGTYTFKFKGSNNNGIWNDAIKELKIIVTPPWWSSKGAYLLYVLTFCMVMLFVLRYYSLLLKTNNIRKMNLFERKKEQEIYNLKLEFFTNLAHEIRTPLTLIKMPLEKIIRKQDLLDHEMVKDLTLIEKNTSRLIRLTNQLLDFRKAETNSMSLIFTKTDINVLLSEVFNYLSYLAREKSLQYDLSLPRINLIAYVDEEALRKVFTNLIHNAIKYAEKEVYVKMLPFNSDDIMFNVEFTNDGEVVPFEKKEKIFEPFFRLNDSDKDSGTGIGLPLSRSLVELHQGTLFFVDVDPSKNMFLLSMPILQEQSLDLQQSEEDLCEVDIMADQHSVSQAEEKAVILIVEDNKEILAYLNKELKSNYRVLRASNGSEALEILDRENVQLVLTDIMMPIMDGLTLCQRIKTDILYSHIPVIFLTAKSALDSKIQGLKIGADAYIEKPFSIEYLTVQVRNILNNRQIVKDYFTTSLTSNLADIKVSEPDKDFIGLLNDVIYNNISDIDLNVDELAKLMNMSRPTLYRKIKGLSDLTPNELINISRLKKAAELLRQKEYSITQIASMVGYSVQSNFSRDFHKHYGMTPSAYINVVL